MFNQTCYTKSTHYNQLIEVSIVNDYCQKAWHCMYNAFETAEFERIVDLTAILHLLQKKNPNFL